MPRHSISKHEEKLDAFFASTKAIEDDEVRSFLARFGIVLTTGYVEQCIKIIILDRLNLNGNSRLQRFMEKHFKRGRNYNLHEIVGLLEHFEEGWREKFKRELEDKDKWKASLKSVYNLRNFIVHGEDRTSTIGEAEDFYKDCKGIVNVVFEITR